MTSQPTEYGPPVVTPHFLSAQIGSTARQNGGAAPISVYNPPGVRSIIPAGSGYSRSESFYSPADDLGRKLYLGDTFTWSGTFVADLGPQRRVTGMSSILWQMHAGGEAADAIELPARLTTGASGTGIGGRDFEGGGSGTSGWWIQLIEGTHGDQMEHSFSISMNLTDVPQAGHVVIEWDGAVVADFQSQTWPDPGIIEEMNIKAGIYSVPASRPPAPRTLTNTWRDVTYTITTP